MNKKTLFIGGIKSGKSLNAQEYILKDSDEKPLYLATTEFIDEGMKLRIDEHKKNRGDDFVTLEEPLRIYETIKASKKPIIVECISMWINNMLHHDFTLQDMINELDKIMLLDKSIVFILNDVVCVLIQYNSFAREFVEISGKISQLIASQSDEVYHTIAGISTRIK